MYLFCGADGDYFCKENSEHLLNSEEKTGALDHKTRCLVAVIPAHEQVL